jgi:PGF-CTERM protein
VAFVDAGRFPPFHVLKGDVGHEELLIMQRATLVIVFAFILTSLAPLALPHAEPNLTSNPVMQSPLSQVSTFSDATQQWMLDNQENNGDDDNDGDNSADDTDRDDDNDCIPDIYDTAPRDFDGDGIRDFEDVDDDGDGILDETEVTDNDPLTNLYDSDNDGLHDCVSMSNYYFDMIDLVLTAEGDHTLHHNTTSYNLITGEDYRIELILLRANASTVTFGGPDGLHHVDTTNHSFQANVDTENRTGSYENLSYGYYCMQALLHTPLDDSALDFTAHHCRTIGVPPSGDNNGGTGDGNGTGTDDGTGDGNTTDDGNGTDDTGNATIIPDFDANVTFECNDGNITVAFHLNVTGLTIDQLQVEWNVSASTAPEVVLESGAATVNALQDGNFSHAHQFSFVPPEQNTTYVLLLTPTSSTQNGLFADAPYLFTFTVNCTTDDVTEGEQDDSGGSNDGDSTPGGDGDGPDIIAGTGPEGGNVTMPSEEPTPGFGLPMALCALLVAAGFARRERD